MNNTKSVIITKSIHKKGVGKIQTPTQSSEVEVRKIGSLFYIYINSTRNGLNRVSAKECWELMADHLRAELLEDPSFGDKKKSKKRKMQSKVV